VVSHRRCRMETRIMIVWHRCPALLGTGW
jgi:hypothetical protein